MSRTYLTMNKHQKHPKVHYSQYLSNADEPKGYISSHDTPAELEAELLGDTESMRGGFRRLAQNMRSRYS